MADYTGFCLPCRTWRSQAIGWKPVVALMWYLIPFGPIVGLFAGLCLLGSCVLLFGIPLFKYIGPMIKYCFWPFGKSIVRQQKAGRDDGNGLIYFCTVLWFLIFGLFIFMLLVPLIAISFYFFVFMCLPMARMLIDLGGGFTVPFAYAIVEETQETVDDQVRRMRFMLRRY